MNPLDQYPGARKALYIIQWIVNLVLGVVAIILTALGKSPEWFVLTGAAFNFVWTYTGITAQANTPAALNAAGDDSEPDDDLTYEQAGGQPFPEAEVDPAVEAPGRHVAGEPPVSGN